MKRLSVVKITLNIFFGVTMFFLIACEKIDESIIIPEEPRTETQKEGAVAVKIRISSEDLTDVDTKARYDGSQKYFKWDNTDQIGVYLAGSAVEKNQNVHFAFDPQKRSSDGRKVGFEGVLESPPLESTLYAYYPFYSSSTITSNAIKFDFPQRQYYVPGGFTGIPAVATYTGSVDDISMGFKSVATIIKLSIAKDESLTENPKLNRIKFESRSSGQKVAGTMSVDFSSGNLNPVFTNLESEFIELYINNPIEITSTAHDFYIAIPPQEYDEGYTFTFYTDKGIFTASAKLPDGYSHSINSLYKTPVLRLKTPVYEIEDNVFRQYLVNKGYVTAVSGRVVTLNSPGDVTVIDLVGTSGVVSLQGIEYFPNLTELYCGNSVGAAGTGNCYIGRNPIATLDVSNNRDLEVLECQGISLKKLDIAGLSSLHTLKANFISALEYLDISGCNELNVLGLYGYANTIISGGELYMRDSKGYDNLKVLKANNLSASSSGDYYIKAIDAYGNNKIEEIYLCNSGGLEVLNVQNCSNLRSVDVDGSGKYSDGMVAVNSFSSNKLRFYQSSEGQYIDRSVIYKEMATGGNGIDLIVMGDGYTRNELTSTKYLKDMKDAVENFFSVEPYDRYRHLFNIYIIAAESNESGITKIGVRDRDTKFKATIASSGTNITSDYDLVISYCKSISEITPNRYFNDNRSNTTALLILNTPDYAGTCAMYSTGFSISMCPIIQGYSPPGDFRGVVMHEAGGHGFARLVDEYRYYTDVIPNSDKDLILEWQSYGCYLNVDLTNDMDEILWKNFKDPKYNNKYDMVGAYEGARFYTQGIWRAEYNHCMNNNIDYFNAQSRWLIYKRMMTIAGYTVSFDDFVDQDLIVDPTTGYRTEDGLRRSSTLPSMPPFAPPVLIVEEPGKLEKVNTVL